MLEQRSFVVVYNVLENELVRIFHFWLGEVLEVEERFVLVGNDADFTHFVEAEGFTHTVVKKEEAIVVREVEELHLVVVT